MWNGGIPILINKIIIKIKLLFIIQNKINITEQHLCNKKYFIILSQKKLKYSFLRKGIKNKVFNSKLIQRISQFLLLIIKIIVNTNIFIQKKITGKYIFLTINFTN